MCGAGAGVVTGGEVNICPNFAKQARFLQTEAELAEEDGGDGKPPEELLVLVTKCRHPKQLE